MVCPGESVPERSWEPVPPATHWAPSPPRLCTAPGSELLGSPQNPFFAICLFSILNIGNGQPVKLNNLDPLFLMPSLAGEINDEFVRRGGGRPKAMQAHSESQWKNPIYQSMWSRGQLRGYQLEFFGPLGEMQPDILMIRSGFQRLCILAT